MFGVLIRQDTHTRARTHTHVHTHYRHTEKTAICKSRGVASEIITLACRPFGFRLLAFRTEKAMAPHSSTLAWKIPWAEEPGRLQSLGWRRVGHD